MDSDTELIPFPFGDPFGFTDTIADISAVFFAPTGAVVPSRYDGVILDDDSSILSPETCTPLQDDVSDAKIVLVFAYPHYHPPYGASYDCKKQWCCSSIFLTAMFSGYPVHILIITDLHDIWGRYIQCI